MNELRFFVDGRAQVAGSKRPFTTKTGQTVVVESGNREAKRSWRHDVQSVAREAMSEQGWERTAGPISLELVFHRTRGLGHYGTGRNERVLKPSAPAYPTSAPDVTKLTRSAEDALTGVVWVDDAQVVVSVLSKVWTCRFTGREGVAVTVRVLPVPVVLVVAPQDLALDLV